MDISVAEAVVIKKLDDAPSWLIICHENPDGDTIGCGLALYSLGARLGKKVRIVGRDPIPELYYFLKGSKDFEAVSELTTRDTDGSLIVCVDTSTSARSAPGLEDAIKLSDSVNIDHHGDNAAYCAVNLVDATASATAEILAGLFERAGWGVTKEEAICLYTALSTDNGSFRFSSTTQRSHICAAKLLAAGVDPSFIDSCVNENMTSDVLKLWGTAFSRTEVFAEGKCAIFWLEHEDFENAGANSSSVDGLVNMLLRIAGVKIAIFMTEINGNNKASIRTKKPYSARKLASLFGGGGHLQAAGAKLPGSFSDALSRMRLEAEKYANDGNTAP